MWGGDDTFSRPHIAKARRTLQLRWQPPQGVQNIVVFHGIRGPFRERINDVLEWLTVHHPDVETFVLTPIGIVPTSLEDLNPFAHLDAPQWVLRHEPEGGVDSARTAPSRTEQRNRGDGGRCWRRHEAAPRSSA